MIERGLTAGLSVVIPVFDRNSSVESACLLNGAIESVFDQKLPANIEVLIIDDGSPVPVELSLKSRRSDARVIVHRIPSNHGLVNALNAGLWMAKYSLIARLDADDIWLPSKLEKQMALFERDADLSISATGMRAVDPCGLEIAEHVRPGDWKGILKFFVEIGCPFPHGSVVARTDIYRLLGGYPCDATFSHCEDYALWGIWLRFFKPAMIEEPLYRYTVSAGSVSSLHSAQQVRASTLVSAKFVKGQLTEQLPKALRSLADVLEVSLIDAGRLAFVIWRYSPRICLPAAAIEHLCVILFDRKFVQSAPNRFVRSWRELLPGFQRLSPLTAASNTAGLFLPS